MSIIEGRNPTDGLFSNTWFCHECHCDHAIGTDCPSAKIWCRECGAFHPTTYICAPKRAVQSGRETGAQKSASAFDKQEGGEHYTKMPIQPFQYSMANGLDPMQHTIIKYVSRFRSKNGIEDLRKAIHTIELLIEFERQQTKD